MNSESDIMSKVFIIGRKQLRILGMTALLIVLVYSFWVWNKSEPTIGTSSNPRVIQLITSEHETTLKDGKKLEVYRWDPGTVIVNEGELVELRILGVNGDRHPFYIEGLDIEGEVQKGKETVVTFRTDKKGIYRLICPTHADPTHGGPMIGYIVVI
jgi:plastocyanin